MKRLMLFKAAALMAGIILIGCGNRPAKNPVVSDNPGAKASPQELARFGRPDIVVPSGQSIQAAVDAASPGAVIHIEPGTYVQAITVSKADIKLIGLVGPNGEGVILENPGEEENGITVTGAGDGFFLANLTVRNFEENGVYLTEVDGFHILRVTAEDNGEYGIYPTRSRNGVIERCSASGHEDTGIYVGRSTGVDVRHCTAFGNVNGFAIHNCSDTRVITNETYDNVVGILVALFSEEPEFTVSNNILVTGNSVYNNNHVNFATPGTPESFFPSGSGILLVGADRSRVEQNQVSGNDFLGIALASTLVFAALANLPPEAFANIEPNPDAARIQDNVLTGNGSSPPPLPIPLPGADLFWDGSGTDNCWSNNTSSLNIPEALPACD